ncbi:hypothetical protein SAMN05216223_101445 [Actinacidiphila yanglinensis]|jgi:hypothetical protein|uniref:Uncharacterized protein n=1 Tax=Actinacidiphila yanglinensis TaxID=310779 RepID=A0A1H5T9Z3_9ACTN|nr:hypothetical protein [Actinacidiphila yanglinensis]SEF59616.1 hypothetical protein SAMN05216223_101445 [Actinacidiphila yanglinensis]
MSSSSEQVHAPARLHLRRRSGYVPAAPVTGALRAVETFLLSGGQQTARRNAWAAVVADRQRAKDRREAEYEMAALAGGERGGAARPR